MGEPVGSLDANLQAEVAGIMLGLTKWITIRSQIDQQQRMIDEIGVLDPSSTQEGLDTLKDLQYVLIEWRNNE